MKSQRKCSMTKVTNTLISMKDETYASFIDSWFMSNLHGTMFLPYMNTINLHLPLKNLHFQNITSLFSINIGSIIIIQNFNCAW